MIVKTKAGMGDILYESATIAFNTDTGLFFNPKDGSVYGPDPPPGGWAISWYQKPDGSVAVPIGRAGVAQNEAEAEALRANVAQSLAHQGVTVNSQPSSSATLAIPAATEETGNWDFLKNLPDTKTLALLAVAAAGVFFLFRKS